MRVLPADATDQLYSLQEDSLGANRRRALRGLGLDQRLQIQKDIGICNEAGDPCDISTLARGQSLIVEEKVESVEEREGLCRVVLDFLNDVMGGCDLVLFELGEEAPYELIFLPLLHQIL